MNAQEKLAPLAALAITLLLVGSRTLADEPPDAQKDAQKTAQLQRNLHDIRTVLDRERSQLDGAMRVNAPRLIVDSKDSPGIGQTREQLVQSLEHLENRCFGIDVNVKDGNAILICGNNNGTADGANVTTTNRTTIVVPPPAPVPAAPPATDDKATKP